MSPYATPIIVVPRKSKPGAPLDETKETSNRLLRIELANCQIQTTEGKSRGSLALVEVTKIGHIWSKLRGAKYFTILDIRSGYHHISIYPDSRPKTAFTCPYGKFQWKRVAFEVQTAPRIFLSLMFKLFFKYLDDFLVFLLDDLLIYSQTEEEHLKHIN